MDPEYPGSTTNKAPRKVKFAPKVPRKVSTPVVPKVEKIENITSDEAQAQELLRRFNEASLKAHTKVERKAAPAQVAFGHGGTSTKIKSYGSLKGSINSYEGQSSEGGGAFSSGLRVDKEYKEPWDYYSSYPVTLPMRRPYSGNPELLDEEEFGEAAESITHDENSTKAARDLGLMDENPEASMFFLQLPPNMPMVKPSPKTEGQEIASSSKPSKGAGPAEKTCTLDELPAGFMGKMLVYKSGAVKLKLGDTIYDVSAGLDCVFAQDIVAINTEEKQCCVLGELSKRAVITPDVDAVLSSMSDLL
ncbi:hypothetical protein RHMOL_Rhmol03G0252800 [Rhododendron molle]|uniref:Uncharacterized protein n=2 Tax=Rhododendron molle TaxID=49168 RepID=A0ACC0PJS9_RHOML|nr:hypothetical protein RHMOL_Rhmol03G0252800 [Rhododendron molle]KAI8565359.1 hypothetical protein RHMOL_Rhmol03G0252800 [Rhododendron molle]